MNATEAKQILDKIIGQICGYQNPLSLEQFMQKFAFDVRLPQQVFDSTDNSPTWASSTNPTKFIKMDTARAKYAENDGFREKRPINNLQELLAMWNDINYFTTEREIESLNVGESDCVLKSENVYRSQDIRRSKNILLSDSIEDSEFIAASQRSGGNAFCIRVEDSGECSNSFGVSWSSKITNSFFIHDCSDIADSMFCSGIKGRQYCIANMQFEKEEYEKLKQQVVQWILTPNS
jgi:hypothetical protein